MKCTFKLAQGLQFCKSSRPNMRFSQLDAKISNITEESAAFFM